MRKLFTLILIGLFALGFAQEEDADLTIVEGLAESGEYGTLVSLLTASGLDQQLADGEFTLFAPNDAAFEELGEETLATLESDPALLEQILLGHVVEGAYGVNDLQDAEEGAITSLQGEPLELELAATGGFTVNGADLDSTDVEFTYSNGVVHGVGDVVIPMSMTEQFAATEDVEEAETPITEEDESETDDMEESEEADEAAEDVEDEMEDDAEEAEGDPLDEETEGEDTN